MTTRRSVDGADQESFRLRVVSDLHVNSRWGLLAPNFTADGEVFAQNSWNRYLWKCWLDMCKNYPIADLLVVNGDTVDGDNPAEKGAGVKSTEPDIMALAAIEVLRPAVARSQKWRLIRGTPYHEKWFALIATELKAERWASGELSGQVLDIAVMHLNFNIAHHPESGAVLYKGTALDKTGRESLIASATGKVPVSSGIIRSHYHGLAVLQSNGVTVIQTPGWELQTPHAKKHGYFRFQPDIGFVDIVVQKDEPYPYVAPHLYPLPPVTVERIA